MNGYVLTVKPKDYDDIKEGRQTMVLGKSDKHYQLGDLVQFICADDNGDEWWTFECYRITNIIRDGDGVKLSIEPASQEIEWVMDN